MDPTSKLIQITKTFGPEKVESLSLPEPFTTTEKPNIFPKVKTILNQPGTNLPPIYSVNYDNYLEKRKKLKSFPYDLYLKARKITNPYEGIGSSIFMNRTATKLANLDAITGFNLTYHIGSFMHLSTPGPFYFADLGGAPGAMTQYILWRRPDSIGYGISLKEERSFPKPGKLTPEVIPTWKMEYLDPTRFYPFYGESGTGNLYTEWKNFINYVLSTQTEGMDLVIGDASFDTEVEKEYDLQEFLSFRLFLVQLLIALHLVREKGSFVMKMFDTVNELSAQLIYIAGLCFEKIRLIKPITSRPANAEKYLVCQDKKKETQDYAYILEVANQIYNRDEVVVSLFEEKLPTKFTKWLINVNTILMKEQEKYIDLIINYLEDKKPEIPQVNTHKALMLFNVPGNPVKSGSVPISTSKGYINYQTS